MACEKILSGHAGARPDPGRPDQRHRRASASPCAASAWTWPGDYGVEIVAGPRPTARRDTDMTPQLTKHPQYRGAAGRCSTPAFGQGPAIVTKNYAQLGIAAPLYQSHGVASKSFIELAGAAANGVRLPAAALLVGRAATRRRPAEAGWWSTTSRPSRPSGSSRSRPSAATPYDGLMILVEAMERAGHLRSRGGARRDRADQRLHGHGRRGQHEPRGPSGPRPGPPSGCSRSVTATGPSSSRTAARGRRRTGGGPDRPFGNRQGAGTRWKPFSSSSFGGADGRRRLRHRRPRLHDHLQRLRRDQFRPGRVRQCWAACAPCSSRSGGCRCRSPRWRR